ncbi:uncharacterized protein BX663DRAFT_512932 [Cokeromyces recurvatus]|uniref:uncharacterized protein n=1 Tax=Cokeromyces recurvatus TaxID=90255 RepID=UPI00221FFD71|nr:uncharacterized protein BX663DRAFT_512932 [Cokeromyces recurvatus]KAI7901929.1 hypothetical protein BX663DRAFT_512932 [Cokeromyces recurvatus]
MNSTKVNSPSNELGTAQKEDCLPCRLSGGAVGLGVGYFSLRKAMQLQRAAGNSNKAVALGVTGVMFASAGLYRLFLY